MRRIVTQYSVNYWYAVRVLGTTYNMLRTRVEYWVRLQSRWWYVVILQLSRLSGVNDMPAHSHPGLFHLSGLGSLACPTGIQPKPAAS